MDMEIMNMDNHMAAMAYLMMVLSADVEKKVVFGC